MLLIVSILLAIVPLLGIVWVLLTRTIFSVDGLFLCLILASISGIFALNAFWEFQRAKRRGFRISRSTARLVSAQTGGSVVRGLVQRVDFYEAHVGQPNKSVITIANGAGLPRIVVLAGDLRNRVPAGKRVQLVYRDMGGVNTLMDTDYA
jgi:hypothetical protein